MVTLSEAQMPNHTHSYMATTEDGEQGSLTNNVYLGISIGSPIYRNSLSNATALDSRTLPNTGGSQAHNNMQPFIAINYIIALQGLYPSRA